jgi:hypothetical protein
LTDRFVFHIRNAPPGDLVATLATLQKHPELSTISEVVERAESMGFAVQDRRRLEALVTARDLGLVDQSRNALTDKGKAVAKLDLHKPDLFADVVHGLLYEAWNSSKQGENCFSWSYRTLCAILWEGSDRKLGSRRDLASEVEARARPAFSRPDISFSAKSVGGALLWLSGLTPPVLSEDEARFSRRSFCPPELLFMAIDFAYRDQDIDYGVNLLLSDRNRIAICQYCLLEVDGFERVLEYAVAQFDCLHQGLGGGWGRYLALDCASKLEHFA